MTDPKSRVQLPSERIDELWGEYKTSPKADAIIAYLDEQAARPVYDYFCAECRISMTRAAARGHECGAKAAPAAPADEERTWRGKCPSCMCLDRYAVADEPCTCAELELARVLDERATVHPIAGGQVAELERRIANLETANAVDFIMGDGSDLGPGLETVVIEPLTTMPKDYESETARHYAETTEENCATRLPYCDPLMAFREVTRWREMQARTYEDGCALLERYRALEAEPGPGKNLGLAREGIRQRNEARAERETLKAQVEQLVGDTQAIAADYTEAQAELTRIKVDNERLKEEISSLKTDLSWEKGWDLCRKAQMGAVVEAARLVAKLDDTDLHDPNLRMESLVAALSALDALSQPEGAWERAAGVSDCGHTSYRCRICSNRVELSLSDPDPAPAGETPATSSRSEPR